MRPSFSLVFSFLVACQGPGAPGADTGDPSNLPSSGSGLTGSTGQSGTMPLMCSELDPGTSPYAYGDPTPAGFSVADALAPILSTGSTLVWEADGTSTGLSGTISIDENSLDIRHDPGTGIVTACVDLQLLTDDGRLNGTLIAAGLEISGIGDASVIHESSAIHLPIDPSMLGGTGYEQLRFDLSLSPGNTSGSLEWADAGSTAWTLAATW